MKAFLTSIGEATTSICKWQLERFGFEVVLLDKIEPWIDKYKRFLEMADEECLRIDADIIPNERIRIFQDSGYLRKNALLAKAYTYDFYANGLMPTAPVYYSKGITKGLKDRITDIDRPETSIWRLRDLHEKAIVLSEVVGIHGFFQARKDIDRGVNNKQVRDQNSQYDFDLLDKLSEEHII